MISLPGASCDIAFGDMNTRLVDWRSFPDDVDADDVESTTTPPDVISMLGFDPKEI